jgi:hypothetical protein
MAGVSLNNSLVNDTSSDTTSEILLSSTVRFWILLIFEIPSLIICLFQLYYLCFDQALRKSLNNHVLINVFLSESIDIPNYLTFLRLNHVWPQSPINCYLWWYVTYGNYNMIGIFIAWASIERHFFIFHHQWLSTKKNRILIHYLPLITLILYTFIFYIVCIFSVPCQANFDYNSNWCGSPCYVQFDALGRFDMLFNAIMPCVVICIANILLFIGVIKQKQRLRQEVQWHKYKRMIIQMASCSLLFLIFQVPSMSLLLAQKFSLPTGASDQFELFIYFSSYFTILWMPFICLGSSKEIWAKLKTIMIPPQLNRIIPRIPQPLQ